MSRAGAAHREKPPVDVVDAMAVSAEEQTAIAVRRAEQLAYNIFRRRVTGYIGAQSQSGEFPPWNRVFVDIPGLPPLNFVARSGSYPDRFAIGVDCPKCGYWNARAFWDIDRLVGIQLAPEKDCSASDCSARVVLWQS